jgi:hypothetical protein
MRGNEIYAAKQAVGHNLRSRWTVLGNPTENILDIDDRLIVEYELHVPLLAQSSNAVAGFLKGQQLAIGIGPAAANLGHLRVGQANIMHMLDIVEQRTRGGVLLPLGQLFNLAQGLFE